MNEIILEASERLKQKGRFREIGFIPGVLYGDNVAGATSIKFEATALKKVIANQGMSAKIWIKYNDNKKYGFIKEVQQHPISKSIIHIDVQIVSKEHEIKMQIPINYNGDDNLKHRQLQLQIYKPEVAVLGKMALMPDTIELDVADMNLGDTITVNDLKLDKLLKVNEVEDAIYATIVHLKNQSVEVVEETEAE
ncbi:MAG: 50S ribosomal protein L25 [Firmicutes bacterium HGW-Firmicutes-7]|nr:MAG: 50S ribosomal protein L25 [Firmicutes bacterium HGW-Firmicutes-7]